MRGYLGAHKWIRIRMRLLQALDLSSSSIHSGVQKYTITDTITIDVRYSMLPYSSRSRCGYGKNSLAMLFPRPLYAQTISLIVPQAEWHLRENAQSSREVGRAENRCKRVPAQTRMLRQILTHESIRTQAPKPTLL